MSLLFSPTYTHTHTFHPSGLDFRIPQLRCGSSCAAPMILEDTVSIKKKLEDSRGMKGAVQLLVWNAACFCRPVHMDKEVAAV